MSGISTKVIINTNCRVLLPSVTPRSTLGRLHAENSTLCAVGVKWYCLNEGDTLLIRAVPFRTWPDLFITTLACDRATR